MPDNKFDKDNSAYSYEKSLYGSKIKSGPKPKAEVGIDTDKQFYQNLISAMQTSHIDISKVNSFSQVAQTRDQIMQLLDTMGQDPTISAALEIYMEDATETNDNGQIMWCESDDKNVASMVNYLLDSMNVDKNIDKWAYQLCKYGDVYLQLYRESDFKDGLFSDIMNKDDSNDDRDTRTLKEDIIVNASHSNDKLVPYVEMVSNPAEVFELTKFGKTYAYIKADVRITSSQTTDAYLNQRLRYSFKKDDINIYQPTDFVHGCLETTTRTPEEVDIFLTNDLEAKDAKKLTYKVRSGQSLLYNAFKIWRILSLLQTSMLLNRLSKSAIVRILNVEVGDMPHEDVGPYLMHIKQLFEQKAEINVNQSIDEYINPGPLDNIIYVPTNEGKGAISTQEVGGDIDVKGLSDIDYFNNLLYGAIRIPKQFMGFTDDDAGFSGGQSLSLISSRYAKMIKRIQNILIQMCTDAVNLMLLDRGLNNYVNKFRLRMQEPTTQEAIDRRDNTSSEIGVVGDIMNLLGDIEDPIAKLKALKSLLSSIVTDEDIIAIIQDEIDRLEAEGTDDGMSDESMDDDFGGDYGGSGGTSSEFDDLGDLGGLDLGGEDTSDNSTEIDNGEESSTESAVGDLPSPSDLGVDMTDNNMEI